MGNPITDILGAFGVGLATVIAADAWSAIKRRATSMRRGYTPRHEIGVIEQQDCWPLERRAATSSRRRRRRSVTGTARL
jgi:hypothetical protein